MTVSVVTIGGGHGQAALLAALCELACEVTAVVSIADDGGCSGELRRELGMAPVGDLRRCLTTLARDRALAERFELRLLEPGAQGRSAGNLALSSAFREYGSLQRAVDWAAELLACRGRVVPVAESPGVLAVYDRDAGTLEGESNVGDRSRRPMVAIVHGPTKTNPVAVEAIARADYIFIGPGSFVTSVLATLTTADVAAAVAASRARKVFLTNLKSESPGGPETADALALEHSRLLRDHLTIGSGGDAVALTVLRHAEGEPGAGGLVDGTPAVFARLAHAGAAVHDPPLVAAALAHHFGLLRATARLPSVRAPSRAKSEAFDAKVADARRRIQARPADGVAPESDSSAVAVEGDERAAAPVDIRRSD